MCVRVCAGEVFSVLARQPGGPHCPLRGLGRNSEEEDHEQPRLHCLPLPSQTQGGESGTDCGRAPLVETHRSEDTSINRTPSSLSLMLYP